MTLIASLSKGGPVIVGDLLVSTSEPGVASLTSSPLWNTMDNSWRTNQGMSVSRLRQKVAVISPRLCVAYAGSMGQATDFINFLRGIELARPPSPHEDIMRYAGDTSNIDYIAYCKIDGGFRSYTNLHEERVGDYTNVLLGGTGASATRHLLNNHRLGEFAGISTSYDVNVLSACGFVGTLAGRQARDGHGTAEAWGGGFEIAVCYDGQFQKLDNILYLFWQFEQVSENGYRVFIEPTYTFQWLTGEDSNFATYLPGEHKIQIHQISPLWEPPRRYITAAARQPMSRSADYIINCLEFKWLTGGVRYGGLCQRSAPGDDHAVFKMGGRDIGVKVNKQFICDVVSGALPGNACIQECSIFGAERPWPPSPAGPSTTSGKAILPACSS